jgi:hypothetical protein
MLQAIKQQALVNEQGRLEIISPELPKGKMVEVVIFIDQEQINTTDYLLSTAANEAHLNKALQDIENKDGYVYIDVEQLVDSKEFIMSGYSETKLSNLVTELSQAEIKLLKSLIEQRERKEAPKTNPKLFDELGLVGGWQVDDASLSQNYKQVLTEQLKAKHGHS